MELECIKHGTVKHYKRKDTAGYRCSKCSMESVDKRRRNLRLLAVNYMGGCCITCGYDTCLAALEFHHLYGKDFGISDGKTRSWERIKQELAKCVLLCANCHREVHANDY